MDRIQLWECFINRSEYESFGRMLQGLVEGLIGVYPPPFGVLKIYNTGVKKVVPGELNKKGPNMNCNL